MTNGKRKGDKFENAVCRVISQWLVPGDWSTCRVDKLPFRRRFTVTASLEGHWVRGGDLLHWPRVKCPFSFECKNQEGWELDGAFYGGKWPPWSWWDQCVDQALSVDRIPLLVFTRNLRPVYVLMAEEIAECLELRPRHGMVAHIAHPDGELFALARLDDLVCVSRSRALRLGPASGGAPSHPSRTTRRLAKGGSAGRGTRPVPRRAVS